VSYLRQWQDVSLVHTEFLYRHGRHFRSSRLLLEESGARPIEGASALVELLRGINWTGTCTFVFRGAFLKEVLSAYRGFVLGYRLIDYPLLLASSALGEIGFIEEPTAVHRYMDGSAMNSGYRSRLEMQESIAACRRHFVELDVVSGTQTVDEPTREELSFLKRLAYLAGDIDKLDLYRGQARRRFGDVDPKDQARRLICRSRGALWLVRRRAERQQEAGYSRWRDTIAGAIEEGDRGGR
jgi:hypothetical protein